VNVGPVTVRLSVVVCVRPPETPEIVIVEVPSVAVEEAVSVSVLVDEVGFGLNPAVTPLGKLEAPKVGLPVKPFTGTTVIVLVPCVPCRTVTEFGFAVRLKFGPALTVTFSVVVCVMLPDTPETVMVVVPGVAVAPAVNVKVLVELVGFGLNPAVTPLGKPDALNVGLPVKPLIGLTVIVVVF
jgi:hypothetical protein